ncbi:MAG TPA: thiazole synthase, partial [Gammaproteobacteria bacterium]|nr:thiazole synthase [Gammaproteobacteria bacterium]
MGCAAVLMNSAIADAQQPVLMAQAMRHAIEAGRLAYLAGRMPKKLYASASSPLDGIIA